MGSRVGERGGLPLGNGSRAVVGRRGRRIRAGPDAGGGTGRVPSDGRCGGALGATVRPDDGLSDRGGAVRALRTAGRASATGSDDHGGRIVRTRLGRRDRVRGCGPEDPRAQEAASGGGSSAHNAVGGRIAGRREDERHVVVLPQPGPAERPSPQLRRRGARSRRRKATGGASAEVRPERVRSGGALYWALGDRHSPRCAGDPKRGGCGRGSGDSRHRVLARAVHHSGRRGQRGHGGGPGPDGPPGVPRHADRPRGHPAC
mmetsp:Transcript_11745/g.33059  ORF Transcript_11745/g.33059 Transcript_11745/m.33059 type:complete len:260 (+) Transcript_11745:6871-7650(+)